MMGLFHGQTDCKRLPYPEKASLLVPMRQSTSNRRNAAWAIGLV
jgi:hypothetical protein